MAKDQRFEKVYSQGTMTTMEIWVDKETGVNYVFHASGAFLWGCRNKYPALCSDK